MTVYDLEYYFEGIGMDERPSIRSVLVGNSRQQLHEIHVQQVGPMGTLVPTEILKVGPEAVLKVNRMTAESTIS
jgi:hypothetical protein